jgi:hypothetical protein
VTRNEELRRKDHIIAALTERIPELEASPDSREGPVTVTEDTDKSTAPLEQQEPVERPSWWRKFFGLE